MRILVVDDHEVVRRGICMVLSAEPLLTLCGEAVDGRDAIEKTEALRPDVVIMDISMPNLNGLEATREIKRILPETEIVIVSQHESSEMVRQAFNAGARAYVVKSTIAADLVAAIKKVNQGEPFVSGAGPANKNHNLDPHQIIQNSAAQESALRESEERFRSTFELAAVGIAHVAPDGSWLRLNRKFCSILGYSESELRRLKYQDVTYPEDVAADVAQAERILAGLSDEYSMEKRYIRKDGSVVWVNLTVSAFRNTDGKVKYFISIAEDLTGHKQAEEALKEREFSARLLQSQDEERRRIARELHDGVGQLLAAMSMNLAKLVSMTERLSPEARKSLDENFGLVEQASREIRTMSHLLHPPLLEEVGLESALRWYVDGFAERSKISVQMRIEEGFSNGLSRELALSLFRIVQESLTNIHRHSQSSTAVVEIRRSPGAIALEIRDEGRGIPLEVQSKISSGESFGVGLRGIRERARQFGGRLEVRSNQGGTRIVAVLPISGSPTTENSTGSESAADPGVPLNSVEEIKGADGVATVLCIDDEEAGLLPRRLVLESAGYRVIDARSGAEGIRLFQTQTVHAVILDYWMSGMKGTAVAAELKRIDPNVPIIVLSGMSDLPGEASGIVDQWLVKGSHRAEQLLNSISTLLERRPV